MGDFLIHYGVKGMKWGVRHDNPNYSSEQRKRDRSIYGRGGVRRINRRMNKGSGILGARSKEADRIYRHRRAGVYTGKAGSIVGGVGGAVIGYKAANAVLKKYGTGDPSVDRTISLAVSLGVSSAASSLGRSGGQSLAMITGGYSPSKFRYR